MLKNSGWGGGAGVSSHGARTDAGTGKKEIQLSREATGTVQTILRAKGAHLNLSVNIYIPQHV